MKGYKLSVIYMTYRPGGFDLLADSLKRQTYKNYELIVVNDLPDSAEPIREYLLSNGIPVSYCGPSKEKCYPDTRYGICNAANTGFLQSTGDIVILVMDYAWLEPHALARWNAAFNVRGLNEIISGIGYMYWVPPPDGDDPVSIWDPHFPEKFQFKGYAAFGGYGEPWIPEPFEMFYSGFPMEFLERINGFDERSDYWRENMLIGVVEQARLNGYVPYVDAVNSVKLAEHRFWGKVDDGLWHINRLDVEGGEEGVRWVPRSPNCFNLEEDRKRSTTG